MEAVEKLRRLLRQRLSPESVPYAMIACDEVLEEIRVPRHHPETQSAWVDAKRLSPSREPYTDEELVKIRVNERPDFAPLGRNLYQSVVIWTLLDMLEEQRGWKP